jgi:hypothetical protein
MAFKMKGKGPMMKSLIGKQNTLPEELQAAIKAAPFKKYSETPMKKDNELPAGFDKMVKANSTNSAGGSINIGATKIATRKNGEFTPVYYQA